MITTATVLRAGLVATLVGLALPVHAQTRTGPEGAANAGVRTPSAGGNEVSPRPGPLPGQSTQSVMPDQSPRSVNEAGEARPEERTTRTTPPPGSASVPNPRTPLSVIEAGDARPLERQQQQGGTTGAPASGATGAGGGTSGGGSTR
jgi:hypothetical protein